MQQPNPAEEVDEKIQYLVNKSKKEGHGGRDHSKTGSKKNNPRKLMSPE